jgi:hypothetical protein
MDLLELGFTQVQQGNGVPARAICFAVDAISLLEERNFHYYNNKHNYYNSF